MYMYMLNIVSFLSLVVFISLHQYCMPNGCKYEPFRLLFTSFFPKFHNVVCIHEKDDKYIQINKQTTRSISHSIFAP